MSILQRQLRVLLAAFLVASLLLASIATGQGLATPCGDRDHHYSTGLSAQLALADTSEITFASEHDDGVAACCSMFGLTCCASTAIRCDDAIPQGRTAVRPAWPVAAIITLHGRGQEVNRRPPRLA